MTADRHVYMPDTRTNSHVHTLTHQTVTEAVCTDTHMSTHTDTCASTQIHTSTVCRHTCRVKNTYTDTHTCMQQTQVHAYTCTRGMGTRIHRSMSTQIHTDTHTYNRHMQTHTEPAARRHSTPTSAHTDTRKHMCVHVHARHTSTTGAQTQLMHGARTHTDLCRHTSTQTHRVPCSLGHTLAGTSPRLPAHFRVAHRPHCPAGPTPSHSSLCGLWPASWTEARAWGLGKRRHWYEPAPGWGEEEAG